MTGLREAFIAANRFGLGARPGQLPTLASDPRGWLESQLDAEPALPEPLRGLPPAREAVAAFLEARREGRDLAKVIRRQAREAYMREAGLRTLAALRSEAPFHERLVAFWSNHFTVSVKRPVLFGVAGGFEREAIRPHVTGRFADMLLAASRHPAMLLYLDNAQSLGPNSRAGRWRGKGLNENLAREILELHTLGVDGGYAQDDVRALAKILTGWSLARPGKDADPGGFKFHRLAHEPGDKTLLGRRYREAGISEGEAALADLARHPATAQHIALKLGRHFIADTPPAAAVDRLARVFRDSDGDLRQVSLALVRLAEPWQEPLAKLKTPQDLVVSTLRATDFRGDAMRLVPPLRLLGQAPWSAPSPAGWPDTAELWAAPDALLKRIEFATAVAQRIGDRLDPRALAKAVIAPVAAPETGTMIARAPSRSDGLTLLLASAEFQRR
ncbi:MAG: DUF1800 domain-containing protein [Kiloniellales bacterium]|nr:DUF1800 domain-containing protein [Kiloniellales bacterium]